MDGYLLIDLTSGIALQRYTQFAFKPNGCMANCLADEYGNSMADPTICKNTLRAVMRSIKLLVDNEFVPTSTTMLFGGN